MAEAILKTTAQSEIIVRRLARSVFVLSSVDGPRSYDLAPGQEFEVALRLVEQPKAKALTAPPEHKMIREPKAKKNKGR